MDANLKMVFKYPQTSKCGHFRDNTGVMHIKILSIIIN